jgi:hypothetical protein
MNKSKTAAVAISAVLVVVGACSATNSTAPVNGLVAKSLAGGTPVIALIHREPENLSKIPEFSNLRVVNWRKHYNDFSTALVKKEAEAGLDSLSLSQALKAIPAASESKGVALLPVAAHSTVYQGVAVWRIDLRWEGIGFGEERMTHVRTHYFTRDGVKQVGFGTCD